LLNQVANERREEEERIRRPEEAAEEQRRRDLEYVRSGMAKVDLMPGVEFENYVAARLRQAGWDVSTTAATGDYGVDLIARKDGECIAVQCKRHGKSVGVSAVQQVVAGAMHHHCTSSMVVSNQKFTRQAKQLARTHNCRLVGRAEPKVELRCRTRTRMLTDQAALFQCAKPVARPTRSARYDRFWP
jgi:restriction system protein